MSYCRLVDFFLDNSWDNVVHQQMNVAYRKQKWTRECQKHATIDYRKSNYLYSIGSWA